jgi:hypothetical protein
MKINDTLIRVENKVKLDNSREQNGLIYAYCHEKNILSKKNNDKILYFVFSNEINNSFILKRSTEILDSLDGVSVSYDTNSYTDYILFQGAKRDDDKKIKLSDDYTRYIFNKKTLCKNKKVIAISSGGQRPLSLSRTEFRNITLDITENYISGFGGRLSYGCGLLIPTKVYCHLLNWVKK